MSEFDEVTDGEEIVEYTGPFDEMVDLSAEGLDDAVEPYALPDGSTALVRILSVHKKVRTDESTYWLITLEPVEHPFAKLITYFVDVPQTVSDLRRKNTARAKMREFCVAFQIDTTVPFRLDELPGSQAIALLTQTTNKRYGVQNNVSALTALPF